MINLIKAELFKLKRNHTFWVLIGVVAFVYSLINYLVIIDWWQLYNTGFESVGLEELAGMDMLKAPLFFNLIIGTLAGFYINIDYATSTIKNQILSGNKRSHIYFAKLVVFSLGSVITAVILPVITAILGTLLLGHSDIYTNSTITYLLRSFGLYTLSIIAYSSIIMLVASLTKESGKIINTTTIGTLILYVIEIFLVPEYAIVSSIYQNSIFYQIYEGFRPILTSNEIGKNILISALTFIFMVYCGSMIFKRKEIK